MIRIWEAHQLQPPQRLRRTVNCQCNHRRPKIFHHWCRM
jgi:hypothetical protein